jgi:hypothetical protein
MDKIVEVLRGLMTQVKAEPGRRTGEDRRRQEETAAALDAEAERKSGEAVALRRAETERKSQEAEAERKRSEAVALRRAETERKRQEAEAERKRGEAVALQRAEAERQSQVADAKRRQEEARKGLEEAQLRRQAEETRGREETEAKQADDQERRGQFHAELGTGSLVGGTPSSEVEVERFSRTAPEYWLRRVAVERRLNPGDQPLVLISFASEDQKWVDDLRTFIDPKIDFLRAEDGQPYHLWNFSDVRRGTAPGDEFPEIVAEKMWRCRASILLFSSHYFRSQYCRSIELPFLLWRRDHHKLMCLPVRIGTLPYDRIRVPNYECESRFVYLKELIDDRQAAANFAASRYRDWSLRQLREEGKESEIEDRFAGIAHHIAEFLKSSFSATEIG